MNKDKLAACSDDFVPAITEILTKYDVHHVLAVLAGNLAAIASSALAAGVSRQYVLEIFVAAIDQGTSPPAKAPAVLYVDGDEVLGRKQ